MASTVNGVSSADKALFDKINGTTSSTAAKKTTAADDMQTRFLNLLVTQLKNQDPLNPTDANQMTTQLSQISTVSGIEKLNATLEKLLGSYSSTQNMQAAAMIGKSVLTAGSSLELGNSGALGGVVLNGAADKVSVTIRDASGKIVQTQNLGAHAAGTVNFVWDGQSDAGLSLANGAYNFSVTASQGGKEVKVTPLQAGTVNAVTLANDGLSLQLANGKTVGYSDIKQIMN